MRRTVGFAALCLYSMIAMPPADLCHADEIVTTADPQGHVVYTFRGGDSDAGTQPPAESPTPVPQVPLVPVPTVVPVPVTEELGLRVSGPNWLVPVQINDGDAVWLRLDTGAAVSCLTRDLAESLQLSIKPSLIAKSGALDAGWSPLGICRAARANLGTLVLTQQSFLCCEEAGDADGSLGMDVLGEFHLELDPEHSLLRLQRWQTAPEIYDGHTGRWWCSRFAALNRLKRYHREWRRLLLRLDPKIDVTALEQAEQWGQSELAKLESEASAAAVPREYRRDTCRPAPRPVVIRP